MRKIKDLDVKEIKQINKLLGVPEDKYQLTAGDIKYQVFIKPQSVFSGKLVVEVYNYLKSVKVEIK